MANRKFPKGFKDEAEFLKHVRDLFQQDIDADRENRDAALDDLKFLAGEQWDEDVKRARLAQGRPCLTINRLPQFVGQVVGDMRINRPSIKIRPAEDADDDLASVRQGLIRGIEYASDAQGVYTSAGEDQAACGIGNFRVNLEWVDGDVFDQDIRIREIGNPLGVVWDHMSIERTGADARHCFVIDEAPRKAFEDKYGPVADGSLADELVSGNWVTRDIVRVVEFWQIKEKDATLAVLQDGRIIDITGKEQQYEGQVARTRQVKRKTACMYLVTGTRVLEGPYELPIGRVPVFRVQGRVIRVGDSRMRFGLVRFAKDPQRLMNYWRSVSAELLAMAPKAQWIATESALEGDLEDDFRNAHKSGDPLLIYKGQTKPDRVDPPAFPAAIIQEANLNSEDMKAVTGLYDSSLGARSNETSGKAIMARERQGDVATYMYHDNLSAAIRAAGEVVNDLIPVVYDAARTIRVIGEDETAKLQRINDPSDPEAIDIGKGKYDTIVETGPSYSTKRVEAADSMTEFMRAFPAAAPVIGDLFAKAQDWPMASEIAARLKKALPPNLQDEDTEEQSPEQQQAKQQAAEQAQQQAQMQQQAVTADVATKVAGAKKAEADALKAEAEAVKAQMELMNGEIAQTMEAVFGQGAAQAFIQAFGAMKAAANQDQEQPPQQAA